MQHILVVENYADLTSAISSSLGGEYDCTCVATPEAAVERLKSASYEAILLAPQMPIKEDPVMHFLHEFQPQEMAKVILMTFPEDVVSGEDDCRVLVKPFEREELFAELAKSE